MGDLSAPYRVSNRLARLIDRGLRGAPAGSRRWHFDTVLKPPTMGTPPDITVGTATSTFVGSAGKDVDELYGGFRYLTLPVVANGGAHQTQISGFPTGNNTTTMVEFDYFGDAFEFLTYGNGKAYRITVDGQRTASDNHGIRTDLPNDSVLHYVLVDLGTRTNWRITLELERGGLFYGLRIPKTASVYRTGMPSDVLACWLGDSWVEGSNATATTYAMDSWADVASRVLGWRRYVKAGIGGTGYLVDGSAGLKYIDRVQQDVIAHDPGAVVVSGGTNDIGAGKTAQQVCDAAVSLVQEITTELPRAAVIVVTPWAATNPSQVFLDAGTLMQTALAGVADIVVNPSSDPVGDHWLQGSGSTTSQNGAGNSDYLVSANHPNWDGAEYLARRFVGALAAQLPV